MPDSAAIDYSEGIPAPAAPTRAPVLDTSLEGAIKSAAAELPSTRAEALAAADRVKETSAAAQRALESRARTATTLATTLHEMRPPAPDKYLEGVPELKPPPQAEQVNPWQAVFNPVTALAFFGGKLTRNPITTGLKAAAAAIDAKREGNFDVYKTAYRDWESSIEYTHKLMKWRLDQYDAALKNHKGNVDQLMGEFNMIANATNDTVMQHTIAAGDAAPAIKLYEDQRKVLDQLITKREELASSERRANIAADARGNTPQMFIYNQLQETWAQTQPPGARPPPEMVAEWWKQAQGRQAANADKVTSLWNLYKSQNPDGEYDAFLARLPSMGVNVNTPEMRMQLEQMKQDGAFNRASIANSDPITKLFNTWKAQPENEGKVFEDFEKSYRALHGTLSVDEKAAFQAAKDVAAKERAAIAKGGYGAPANIAVDDGNGGLITVSAQQDKATGQWVTADEKRTPLSNVARVIKSGEVRPDDPHVESMAKMIASYQLAPLSGISMRSEFGQAVMDRVGELNSEYNANLYTQANRMMTAFGSGAQGNSVRSFNVTISHLATLENLIGALKNGDLQVANRLSNDIARETGNPAPTNFDSAKQIIGQEIVKAIIAGGGGVTERQAAEKHLDTAQSPEQLLGVIRTYKELMAGQLDGLRRQYETAKGGLPKFDSMLSPQTLEQMKEMRSASDNAVKNAATAAWGGFDPSKFDYRIVNGVIQRKAKE